MLISFSKDRNLDFTALQYFYYLLPLPVVGYNPYLFFCMGMSRSKENARRDDISEENIWTGSNRKMKKVL